MSGSVDRGEAVRILAFADLCPSEGEALRPEEVLSVAISVTGSIAAAVVPPVQYKDARRRKAQIATKLANVIAAGEAPDLFTIVGFATGDAITKSGEVILDWLGLDFASGHVRLGTRPLTSARAKAYAWYSWALSTLSTSLGQLGAVLLADRVDLILDPIAGDSLGGPQPGLDLVKHTTRKLLVSFWHESATRSFLDFALGYATTKDRSDPKKLKDAIMADWIAAACHAQVNPHRFDGNEELARAVSAPLIALQARGQAQIVETELRCSHLDLYLTPERRRMLANPRPLPPPVSVQVVAGPGAPEVSAMDLLRELTDAERAVLFDYTRPRRSARRRATFFDGRKMVRDRLRGLGILDERGLTSMGEVVSMLVSQQRNRSK